MQVMNPNGFEKGQGESESDYSERLKTTAGNLNDGLAASKQETQKWKKMAIGAFIAAALLFLFSVFLLCDNSSDRKEAKAVHKVELKKLQDEVDKLKLAAQNAPKAETFGVSAEEVRKIVGEKCVGKEVPVAQKPPAKKKTSAAAPALPAPSKQAEPLHKGTANLIWLWHPYFASDKNPQKCVIDSGDGSGLPPRCSSFQLLARAGNEAKSDWLVRAAKLVRPSDTNRPTDTGLYNKGS